MARRIMWVSPSGGGPVQEPKKEYMKRYCHPDTEVEVISMPRGPHHLEYQYYCALAIPDILHAVKRAAKDGFDGAIIGGFYDLGLREAREITEDFVVTAPAEACMHIAATLGDSFSIIVGHDRWIPTMKDRVILYGLEDKLASFKSISMGVLELQKDHRETLMRLTAAAKEAINEDKADTIILGCTAKYGFFQEMQEELGVPVIDPILGPFKYAEFLIELKERFGWSHSKLRRYQSPPAKEIRDWNLASQYSFDESIWG